VDKDRLFWEAVRRALLAFVKAIEVRYHLGKADNAQATTEVLYSQQH
jgi:hypothetical protein